MFEKKCPKYLKTFLQYVLSIKIVLFVFSNMLLSKYAFYVELQDCNLKNISKIFGKNLNRKHQILIYFNRNAFI